MTSLRCSQCATNWPNMDRFKRCPECDVQCSRFWSATPVDEEEATSRYNHAKFEEFYAQREAERTRVFAAEMTERMSAIEES